jgi:microsomal epoxide hydrolase
MQPRNILIVCTSLVLQRVSASKIRDVPAWHGLPKTPFIPVKPTKIAIPSDSLDQLDQQLSLFEGFQPTYENTREDMQYGMNINWMTNAYNQWKASFTWRDVEASINRHPHFEANVTNDDGEILQIHFMGVFSKKHNAIPIAFFHGWPGSFLEFLDLLDVVKTRYTPESSPYHVIVPSLPGFTLSSGPPTHSDWGIANTSSIMDKLLRGLGFEDGYVAQGGDIGAFVARTLGLTSSSCKGEY